MLILLAATGITVLAIACTFGSQGYDVAPISRNPSKLDVLDHATLTQALKDATTQSSGIDVLEYTPSAGLDTTPVIADRGEVRQARRDGDQRAHHQAPLGNDHPGNREALYRRTAEISPPGRSSRCDGVLIGRP
ncbi:hypothetical protein [Streptomyces umbrinus]|uniref:hypothetical protein n=1 Tax=Streptomyces umbrinus TaxID=67370 RepID=UPI0033DEA6F1